MTYARPLTHHPHHDPEAEKIIAAERARKEPQNCARCDRMSAGGWCDAFNEAPPVEFLTRENDCPLYLYWIPF